MLGRTSIVRDKIINNSDIQDEDFCVVGISKEEFCMLFPDAKKRGKSFEVFDLNNREFALARKEFGSVATEAAPADYCADVVDLGAFFFFTQKIHPGFIDPVPIPLWQLVYHDSVLGYTGEGLCGYSGGDYLAMTAL